MSCITNRVEEEKSSKLPKCVDFFYVLPEACIAATISFTGPRDACRFASVSLVFKSAANSDAVWCHFLPADYQEILARSDDVKMLALLDSLSKRDLFLHLADHHLLLDASTKSFSLDKPTGKKCYTISARELAITWSDTPRYWAFHSLPESRFPEVAELNSVCWLEIKGKMKESMLSPDTTYAAYLVFKMAEAAFGFHTPAQLTVKTPGPGGKTQTRQVYLENEEEGKPRYRVVPRRIGMGLGIVSRIRTPMFEVPEPIKREENTLPKERRDGWLEVEIGELLSRAGEDGDVEMSVFEVEAGNWKSGLVVEGIELRPKVVAPL